VRRADKTHGCEIVECPSSAVLVESPYPQRTSPHRDDLEIHDLWSVEKLFVGEALAGAIAFRTVIRQRGRQNRRIDDDHCERASRSALIRSAA
jgi:hypothetical protein